MDRACRETTSRPRAKAGRKPALETCLAIAAALEKRRAHWDHLDIAATRFEGAAHRRVAANLRKWFDDKAVETRLLTRRGLRALAEAGEHRARGRLGLRLERALLNLCEQRHDGPDAAVIAAIPPSENPVLAIESPALSLTELEALCIALEQGDCRKGYAGDFRKLAGPGLASFWKKHYGRPKNHLRRNRTEKADRTDAPPALTQHARRNCAPTSASAPTPAKREAAPEHEAPTPTRSPRRAKRFGKALAAALACGLALSAAAFNYLDPQWRAYWVLTHQGGAEALQYIRQQIKGDTHGEYFCYLLGMSLYLNGRLEEARDIAEDVMAHTGNDYSKAFFHYLLGGIELDEGRTDLSTLHFREALRNLHNAGGSKPHEYLMTLALSKNYLELNEMPRATIYWEEAVSLKRHAPNLFELWQTAGRIHYEQGQFEAAAELFQRSFGLALENGQLFNYHAWMAACAWASGDLDAAFVHIDEAEPLVSNQRMRAHLNTLKIGLRICYGQNFARLENQVSNWLDRHPDASLKRMLDRVRHCPIQQR